MADAMAKGECPDPGPNPPYDWLSHRVIQVNIYRYIYIYIYIYIDIYLYIYIFIDTFIYVHL